MIKIRTLLLWVECGPYVIYRIGGLKGGLLSFLLRSRNI